MQAMRGFPALGIRVPGQRTDTCGSVEPWLQLVSAPALKMGMISAMLRLWSLEVDPAARVWNSSSACSGSKASLGTTHELLLQGSNHSVFRPLGRRVEMTSVN